MRKLTEIIKNVVERNGFSLYRLILFGSRAKGNADMDSDWDILVVVKESISMEEKKNLWKAVYKALRRAFPSDAFDVIVKSAAEHEKDATAVNTISSEAESDGVILLGGEFP